jgi:hypothetical protein
MPRRIAHCEERSLNEAVILVRNAYFGRISVGLQPADYRKTTILDSGATAKTHLIEKPEFEHGDISLDTAAFQSRTCLTALFRPPGPVSAQPVAPSAAAGRRASEHNVLRAQCRGLRVLGFWLDGRPLGPLRRATLGAGGAASTMPLAGTVLTLPSSPPSIVPATGARGGPELIPASNSNDMLILDGLNPGLEDGGHLRATPSRHSAEAAGAAVRLASAAA